MKGRTAGYLAWLIAAGCLYFFENGAATRILLFCTLLVPAVPALRAVFFSRDRAEFSARQTLTVRHFSRRDWEEPGDLRAYVPGDPVSRVHWKLSAKKGELLVRPEASGIIEEEAEKDIYVPDAGEGQMRTRRRAALIALASVPLFLLLLWLIPEANRGAQALLNRLYDASEAVNAYAYQRFAVAAGQPAWLSALLLSAALLALLAAVILSGRRWPALIFMISAAALQAYFGLLLPLWAHIIALAAFALWTARRPLTRRRAGMILAVILLATLTVIFIWPGADAGTEAASEKVRDWLGRKAMEITGMTQEMPEGDTETRHAHTQTLTEGSGEAAPEKEYRLVTVGEEHISRPRWINYLKIILLLLLFAALLVVPFLPFVLLNARRKKALAAREAFQSGDVSEAVCAIFQHVTAWLEAAGLGAGNLPYRAWPERFSGELAGDYALRFGACAEAFEEAAYSRHLLGEEKRQKALELLEETERALKARADWKQRFTLKYRECLWV